MVVMIYICEYCNEIKEAPDSEVREAARLSDMESIADVFGPTPHYLCPSCIRKILGVLEE